MKLFIIFSKNSVGSRSINQPNKRSQVGQCLKENMFFLPLKLILSSEKKNNKKCKISCISVVQFNWIDAQQNNKTKNQNYYHIKRDRVKILYEYKKGILFNYYRNIYKIIKS